MGNEITTQGKTKLTRAETLNLMKPVKELCGSQAAQKNEALIAFELEVASVKLDRFGWSGLSQAMKDRLTADWVDVLGGYDVREVKRGIAECLSSKSKTPTEYEVQAAIETYRMAAIRRAAPDRQPQPEPERVEATTESRWRVAAMVAELGGSKRVGGVK